MKITLEPRRNSDRGGFLTMPLRKNIPEPNDKSWVLTTCPACGRESWERPVPDWLRQSVDGIVCTECALRISLEEGDD